jgi:hypothetical protein
MVCLLPGEVSGNSTNVGEAASATLEFSRLTYITGGEFSLHSIHNEVQKHYAPQLTYSTGGRGSSACIQFTMKFRSIMLLS